jgi:hypothetical protein
MLGHMHSVQNVLLFIIIPILMSQSDVLPTFKDGRTGKRSKNIIIIALTILFCAFTEFTNQIQRQDEDLRTTLSCKLYLYIQ